MQIDQQGGTDLISQFLEEDVVGFRAELESLLDLPDPANPRICIYTLTEPSLDIEKEASLTEYSRSNSGWHSTAAKFAPPTRVHKDLSLLREKMDSFREIIAPGEIAVAVWIVPGPGLLLLFFRDSTGKDELAIYDGRLDRRSTIESLEKLFDTWRLDDAHGSRLVSALDKQATRDELSALTKDEPLTELQLQMLLDWMKQSLTFRNAVEAICDEEVEPVMDEAHRFLEASSRAVEDFCDEIRADNKAQLEQLEKLQEKRMKGLRADNEKMRMLAEGTTARANKADKDNRDLRQRIRQLEGTSQAEANDMGPVEPRDVAVRRALDAFF